MAKSGKHGDNGRHARNGYRIAIKAVNELGGIKIGGKIYKLKLKYYDDESNPLLSAKYAKRLLKKDKVHFLLGPYSSSATDAVANVAEQFRVPFVQGNGAARSLFDKDRKYMFGVMSTAEKYLADGLNLLTEQARSRGGKADNLKVAVAVEPDAFSMDLRQGILADAKKFGMSVVVDEKLPRDFNDITFILKKVVAEKPDILVVSGHEEGASLAVRQIKEQKIDVPMLAMTHCEGADVHSRYGTAADYTICASQWSSTLTYKDRWFGSASKYKRRFESEYGYEPPYQAAESSASVLVFADAIERAGSLDREKVRAALGKTDLETFFGWVKFDSNGRNTAKPMVLRQLIQGRYIIVAPSAFAVQKVVYPRPNWSNR